MKKVLLVFVVLAIIFTVGTGVFADTFRPTPVNGTVDNNIKSATQDAWATAIVIIRILAVAAVVFAGLRYMFASADQKADIKNGLIYLSVGAVLVFGATVIINVVVNSFNEIAN